METSLSPVGLLLVSPLLVLAPQRLEIPPAPGSEPGCSFSPRLRSPPRWGWSFSLGGLWALLGLPVHPSTPAAKRGTVRILNSAGLRCAVPMSNSLSLHTFPAATRHSSQGSTPKLMPDLLEVTVTLQVHKHPNEQPGTASPVPNQETWTPPPENVTASSSH